MLVSILTGAGIHHIMGVSMVVITAVVIGTMDSTMDLVVGVILIMLETIGTDITMDSIMVTTTDIGTVMEIIMVMETADLHVKEEETWRVILGLTTVELEAQIQMLDQPFLK
jgi:hypothetical protein